MRRKSVWKITLRTHRHGRFKVCVLVLVNAGACVMPGERIYGVATLVDDRCLKSYLVHIFDIIFT